MESSAGPLASLLEFLGSSPMRGLTALAAALSLAFTPLAFVLLARRDYLFARRGRVFRRPEWWSVVCSMLLVMGIPAILLAFLIKSEQFDKSRYEFDPNQTFSVLDQGRQFQSIDRVRSVREAYEAVRSELRRLTSARDRLQQQVASLDQASAQLASLSERAPDLKPQLAPLLSRIHDLRDAVQLDTFNPDQVVAELDRTEKLLGSSSDLQTMEIDDEAVRREMGRLADMRKELVDKVKAIDDLLIPFRAASAQSSALSASIDPLLERLSEIRRSIGLDAPQQLLVEDASPVELRRVLAALGPLAPGPVVIASSPAASSSATPESPPEGPGLSSIQREAELALVPEPQRALASLLPLSNLPDGWELGKSGERFLETFNAENLYEKIDGRAESFLQYDVRGMAYTYYHPTGDPSAEAQLYIFEMGSPLKALGKFGSEKPEEFEPVQLGAEGYTSGASVFFHAKNLYVQIVCTSDEPSFKEFALSLARRISEQVITDSSGSSPASPSAPPDARAAAPPAPSSNLSQLGPSVEPSPDLIFALLPSSSGKANQKYVAQDVFGYSFLSDTFMADYSDGEATWQGFIRTYPTPDEARKVFDQYRAESESFGAKITELKLESADSAFQAENFGQYDLILLKGNALAGVNGSTALDPALKFAEQFALKLPPSSPFLPPEAPAQGPEAGGEGY